jgi:DtxR family Mn-dependent transcriptional regulator
MNELVDPTEMYLRTIWELEEEGIAALRARLVERLHLSAPSVSETISRLAEEGLVTVGENRVLSLTEEGRRQAVSVMRKHRLAERLLTDVIDLDWAYVHTEACRWEHVISSRVENRLVRLLNRPERDAHGNPIPGLGEGPQRSDLHALHEVVDSRALIVERLSEYLQSDELLMAALDAAGMRPTAKIEAHADAGGGVVLQREGAEVRLTTDQANLVYVRSA